MMEGEEDDGAAAAAGSSGAGSLAGLKKVKVAPPWDPLRSPDWDQETHSKEALFRIKR